MAKPSPEEIYDRHVRGLSAGERLRLLVLLARDLEAEAAVGAQEATRSIMELHGLGREIWEGVDAQEYVHHLRDEWDASPS